MGFSSSGLLSDIPAIWSVQQSRTRDEISAGLDMIHLRIRQHHHTTKTSSTSTTLCISSSDSANKPFSYRWMGRYTRAPKHLMDTMPNSSRGKARTAPPSTQHQGHGAKAYFTQAKAYPAFGLFRSSQGMDPLAGHLLIILNEGALSSVTGKHVGERARKHGHLGTLRAMELRLPALAYAMERAHGRLDSSLQAKGG